MKIKETLVVDSREPEEVVKAFEESGLFANIVVRELDVGDVKIGKLRIERKAFPDYLNSWRDGRLDSQIERLCNLPDEVGIIIIHDVSKSNPWIDKGMRISGIKHIDSLNFVLPVFKAQNLKSFVKKVSIYARHAIDGEYLFHFEGRRTEIEASPNDIVNLYTGFPGVETKLAKRIYKKYPVPAKLFARMKKCGVLNPPKKGGRAELLKKAWFTGIKGIGYGKAKEIEELILLGIK